MSEILVLRCSFTLGDSMGTDMLIRDSNGIRTSTVCLHLPLLPEYRHGVISQLRTWLSFPGILDSFPLEL